MVTQEGHGRGIRLEWGKLGTGQGLGVVTWAKSWVGLQTNDGASARRAFGALYGSLRERRLEQELNEAGPAKAWMSLNFHRPANLVDDGKLWIADAECVCDGQAAQNG